jgi:hypothetical protein
VLDETPEATTLRHDARSHVLDLTQPLPPAQGGQLVVAARTGVVQTAPPGYSQAPNPTSTQPAAAAAKLPPLAPPSLDSPPVPGPPAGHSRSLVPQLAPQPLFTLDSAQTPTRKRASPLFLITATTLLLLAPIAGYVVWVMKLLELPVLETVSASNPADARPTLLADNVANTPPAPPDEPVAPSTAPPAEAASTSAPEPPMAAATATATPPPMPAPLPAPMPAQEPTAVAAAVAPPVPAPPPAEKPAPPPNRPPSI